MINIACQSQGCIIQLPTCINLVLMPYIVHANEINGSHNAICSIVARVGSTLILVSLTVPTIEPRRAMTDVIAN